MITQVKEDFQNLPSWARMLIAFGVVASIIKWFPIAELLQLFGYVVIVPLGFLTFLGIVSAETTNGVAQAWNTVVNTIRERTTELATETATQTEEETTETQTPAETEQA
jgi:hypothetical protein